MNERGELSCQEVTELLPWLLNGTLEAGEAEHVRAHLGSCTSCRHQLGETRWAAAVFGAHVPAQDLVALAWDGPGDLEPARRHVEGCPACAGELALIRQSRGLEADADSRPVARPAPFAVRYGSLAAALVVGFAAGLLSLRMIASRPLEEQAQRLAGRVGELEEQVRGLRESESSLRDTVRRLEAPEPNLPIVEVLPDSAARRSPTGPETRVVVPAGARLVALVLGSDRATSAANAELRDTRGVVIWTGGDLQPSPLGGYTLGLPASLLAEGRYTLVLRPSHGSPETYSIRVERRP
jgi:hypothetical protein